MKQKKGSRERNARYNEKRKNKGVPFRIDDEEDKKLLDYAESLPNFTEWVKLKIKEEMSG